MEKVEDIWDLGRTTIKVSALWKCLQLYPLEDVRDITLLELIPVVLAISTWGSQFSNKKLIMHVDNEALVSVINKQTSKSKNVMTLVRTLVLCLLQNNTTFRSEHVPGSSNKIADSISRKQWSRFRTLAPEADEFPTKIPTPFAEMIFNLKLTDC